jgi:hypothetical protein
MANAKKYKVTGAVAVVRAGGASRYLYKGAPVPEQADNLEHLIAVGLVSLDKVATELAAATSSESSPAQTPAQKAAAAKAAADAKAKADADAAKKAEAEAKAAADAAAAEAAAGGK